MPFPLAQTPSSNNDKSPENGTIDKVCIQCVTYLHIPAVTVVFIMMKLVMCAVNVCFRMSVKRIFQN